MEYMVSYWTGVTLSHSSANYCGNLDNCKEFLNKLIERNDPKYLKVMFFEIMPQVGVSFTRDLKPIDSLPN